MPDPAPGVALAEQHDAVGEHECFIDVVGDEEDRGRLDAVDVEQEVLHGEPGERIQGSERLIEDEHAGVAGECPGQRSALRHPTARSRAAAGGPHG